MKRTGGLFVAAFLVSTVVAVESCNHSPTAPNGPAPARTTLPRALTASEQKIVGATNAFSFALWGKVNAAQPGANVFISPLSVSFALGMTLNGAAGQTYDEMSAALQFGGATQAEIDSGYRSLISLLMNLDPAVRVQVANSIWYRSGFPFYQSFLDAGRTYFGAEIRGLNFDDVPGSLAIINGWVNGATNGKIPTILDGIDPADVMFLINAIYFNGNWRAKFDPAETQSASFHAGDGSTQTMQLMHRYGSMSYAETPAYQAVDLPYGDSVFMMTVILPSANTDVDALAASLTPQSWATLTGGLRVGMVDLSLPKLKLNYARTLNDDLEALGMVSAFDQNADFSRMSSSGGLLISFVKQKAYVDVNENGTEAAAATITGIVATAAPAFATMRVDHPYLFAIRERLTGTVLFMGKVASMP